MENQVKDNKSQQLLTQILSLILIKRDKTIFLFLSLVLWVGSSHISDYCFPTNTLKDIDNYWNLKKIIYSICIVLVLLSGEYKSSLKKFISLCFIGILSQDISDRLENITYFQWSDLIVVELILLSSAYIIYKDVINNKIINSDFFRSIRNKTF